MKNNAINFWKGIACICVILIHHDFPEPLHPYTMGIYRFAVPFFFMVSGYYFLDKNLMFNEKRTKASAVKMLKYAFSMVGIYCAKSFADSCILSDVSFVTWLVSNLSFGKIFTWIVLNDAPFSGMSWYLWSMVCVYVVAYTVESAKKRQYMYYISPMLLFCHFLIGNLFPVFGIRVNVHLYMNWFLFGLPFFYIGLCIREYSHLLKKVRIGWSVIPFVLSFFEVKIFGGGGRNLFHLNYYSYNYFCLEHPKSRYAN